MRLKIRYDGKSWKILGFRVEVNKALVRRSKSLWAQIGHILHLAII